jgi:NAD(P)H-dependent FMN reductase
MSTNILAFAGSSRRRSFNRRVLELAVAGAREAGAQVEVITLADFPMPLFDQNLEAAEGLPDGVLRLKERLAAHQGLLIATPEYNSSFTPLLKNAIDWCSRAAADEEPPLAVFRGKVAGLVSASPGGTGGLRSLAQTRRLLQNIGVMVVPKQHGLAAAHQRLDETGFGGSKDALALKAVGRQLAQVVAKLE